MACDELNKQAECRERAACLLDGGHSLTGIAPSVVESTASNDLFVVSGITAAESELCLDKEAVQEVRSAFDKLEQACAVLNSKRRCLLAEAMTNCLAIPSRFLSKIQSRRQSKKTTSRQC